MLDELFGDAETNMNKAVQAVDHDLKSLRTGRASTAMVEAIVVAAYGTDNPLRQLATINTPDASTILIQPFDPNLLASIEKALLAANLGMTPNNDGKIIRLHVPALTEETRKEMVKKAHKLAEHGRVAVRNVRRHANDEIKKTEKQHEISEDDRKRFLDRVQKMTDEYVQKIDTVMTAKEKEIMQV